MHKVASVNSLRNTVRGWRARQKRIVLVPTMGNLHAGHLSLVERGRQLGDRVVASIFVNPTQFGEGEDYATYPRTLARDCELLRANGCDLVFAPGEAEMYPQGDTATRVCVGELGQILCGAFRPGHFDAVATVVVKLLSQVQPDTAVFGEKDFQQLAVIRQVVRDLDLPVAIHAGRIVREKDGLAMSSRNRYLTERQRQVAPLLFRVLSEVATRISGGSREFDQLQHGAVQELHAAGFEPEYVAVRDCSLGIAKPGSACLVVLAAARLGRARLIDNVIVGGLQRDT